MTYDAFVALVASKAEVTVREAAAVLTGLRRALPQALKDADLVHIPDVGRWKVKTRGARTARDPRTQAEIKVPAKRVVTFSPAGVLQDAVEK